MMKLNGLNTRQLRKYLNEMAKTKSMSCSCSQKIDYLYEKYISFDAYITALMFNDIITFDEYLKISNAGFKLWMKIEGELRW